MPSFEKFNKTFPSKTKFYSSLNSEKISDKDHKHVLKDLNKIELKTLKDYHDFNFKK